MKIPSSIENATNLRLHLQCCSDLVELPSTGNATNLQWLDLSYCSSLVKLPSSFSDATNLQRLNLSNCSNLVELPSIGNATKLEQLDVSNCSSLVKLPSSIIATNPKRLSLKNCSRVVGLPAIENATNLEILELKNCSSLWELDMSGCSSLLKLPTSIGDITNLKMFNLSNCSSLVELPSSIRNLQRLYELIMCGCSKLEALPTNINLKSLDTLDLTNCSQLKSFSEISTSIMSLSLIGTAIKEVLLTIMSWSRLFKFQMPYFERLNEFPPALDIRTGLQLNEDIQEVAPWVQGMSPLCELRLKNYNKLVSVPQFSDSLWYIYVDSCKSLERLDCSFNFPEICLKFTNCFKLNLEARDLIMHTLTSGYAVLPGIQVPACFDYLATAGGSLTIKLNERHLSTSLIFKACIMLVEDKEETGDEEEIDDEETETSMSVYIDIMEKKNDLTFLLRSHYIKPILTEHIYTFEVEAEEVTSNELFFEFKPRSRKWKIRECGLYQILEVNG